MSDNPAISIIIPVYNIEEHIGKCLDSILNQTFTNFEVIIVNDGSTDQSGEICDEYAKKDKRIKVIHQNKQGVSVARNTGVSKAKGDYIGFVDGDDHITEDMYEKLYQACKETKSNIAICKLGREIDGKIINNTADQEYKLELINEDAMKELFKGILYRFSLCNKLFSKKCFEGVIFPVGRIHEDLSTTYKLFANANKAVYINFVGYIYVKQVESILTKSYYEKRLEAFVGWEEILIFMQKEYPQLDDRVNACFTYSCMDHIYYIFNEVTRTENKVKYLKMIRVHLRKDYLKIYKNRLLSIKPKFLISLFCFSIHMFSFLHRFKMNRAT